MHRKLSWSHTPLIDLLVSPLTFLVHFDKVRRFENSFLRRCIVQLSLKPQSGRMRVSTVVSTTRAADNL